MKKYMFDNFLSSQSEYRSLEKFWASLLDQSVGKSCLDEERWCIEYGVKLGGGGVLRDGNPLLSAYSNSSRKYLRIVVLDPEVCEKDFNAWVKLDEENGVIELTISCAMSLKSIEKAETLLKLYLNDENSIEEIERHIDVVLQDA